MNSQLQELSKESDKVIDEFNIAKIKNHYDVSFEKIETDNIVEKIIRGEDSVLLKFRYGKMLNLKNDIIKKITGGSISLLTMYTYEELIIMAGNYEDIINEK